MSAAAHAVAVAPLLTPQAAHVFAVGSVMGRAAGLAAVVDATFLVEAEWDPTALVLSCPPQHPLLGRPVCRTRGCWTTAPTRARICGSCRGLLAERGLSEAEIDRLPARSGARRGPSGCAVTGCARERVSSGTGLCRGHLKQADRLGIGAAELSDHPAARPLVACGPCEVAACTRQRRHPDGVYCEAHQMRLRALRRRDPHLDEQRWQLTEAAVGVGGQVSFRGLAPLVVAEVLVGLQQRCQVDGVKTKEADLRMLCNQLRRQHVATLADFVPATDSDGTFRALCNAVTAHARRALATPATEVVKDEWDLVVFSQAGTVSFTQISQPWLRELTKRWAAADLPKRRSTTFKAGLAVRHHIGCVARLSQSLRIRADRGEVPAALGRTDMKFFLNRLAYQQAAGTISVDGRIRACREVRKVLSTARATGLTRPGGPAAGLGEDFAIGVTDVPHKPEPA